MESAYIRLMCTFHGAFNVKIMVFLQLKAIV